MSLFVDQLEKTCQCGAEQLSCDARDRMIAAVQRLQCASGGYMGLDGHADPYYSFFAYQCLRALHVPIDRDALFAYASTCTTTAYADAVAAEALRQACILNGSPTTALRMLLKSVTENDAYARFFALWQADRAFAPRVLHWWARLAWMRMRARVLEQTGLVMPHLAIALVVAHVAGDAAATRKLIMKIQRHRVAGGGFSSTSGQCADLLATAVAVSALRLAGAQKAMNRHRAIDRDFVELCWREDDLFGATPLAEHGDAEYTFYGLLALGALHA